MIIYILKSAACLALLLFFYYLVLEKEKMHQFNRFYLLGSVIFSFLVPLYTIYVTPAVIETQPVLIDTISTDYPVLNTDLQEINTINYTVILYYIYALISSMLFIRFGRNIFTLLRKINQHQTIRHNSAVLVLVEDKILPHTFWNYIFINKEDYFKENIEEELFTHELTHVTQKHTLDILLIEFLQVFFWINPLFIFIKKAIQLNHEFLADKKVIDTHKNPFLYQHLLVNKAAWKNEYYLASNLNYSLTKKRLKMMTTQSSPVKILLKKLVVIPLVVGFVFLFAERVEAQKVIVEEKETPVETIYEQKTSEKQEYINSKLYKEYMYNKGYFTIISKDGKKIAKKYNELTEEEKKNLLPPPPLKRKKNRPTKQQFENLKNKQKYAVWIDGKVADNKILNNYKYSDFEVYSNSFVHKNARSKRFPQEYQAHLETKKYFLAQNKRRLNNYLKYLKEKHNIEEVEEEKLQYVKIVEETANKKNTTPEFHYKKQTFWVKNSKGKKVAKKYYELSNYNKKRWLLFPTNPSYKRVLSENIFNKLKNKNTYVVRVDGNLIDNKTLKNYKPSDFYTFSKNTISKLTGLKQKYHYNLITKKGYEIYKQLEKGIKKRKKKYNLPSSNGSKQSIIKTFNKKDNRYINKQYLRTDSGFKSINGIVLYYVKNNGKTKYYNKNGKLSDKFGKQLSDKKANASEIIPEIYVKKVYYKDTIFCEFFDDKPNLSKKENDDFEKFIKFSIESESKNNPVEKYLKTNELYEYQRTQKPHYIKSNPKRKAALDSKFSLLGTLYFKLSKANKRKIKRPIFPHYPYVKLKKNDKVYYKLKKDLTESDKMLLPPPPPPRKNGF